MAAALVERMAPEDLWTLFERVVPPAPVRPQGGGHRRRGDREVLAAIIFVATSGCTWNQLPPGFGLSGVTAFRRFTEGPRPGCGPISTAWSSTNSVPGASWTGRAARSTPSASEPSKGAADGTESDRPRQERIENPPHRRPPGSAPVDRHLRHQPPRQPGTDTTGPRHPTHPLPSWPTAPAARQTARRQGLRLPPPAAMARIPRHPAPPRSQGRRVIPTPGPTPLGRGTDRVLAVRLPTPAPPLRAQT